MSRRITIHEIPESLIYEMVDGVPIYYRGYKDVLSGNKQLDQIIGDSNIQAWLKIQLGTLLTNQLGTKYVITGGEHGLHFKKKSWRAAGLAIFKSKFFEWTNTYSKKAPEVVIEIDTKADLEKFEEAINYFDEKTEQLLGFGVKKVIWIFTSTEKVKVITSKQRLTFDWNEDVQILEKCSVNLQTIIDAAPFKK